MLNVWFMKKATPQPPGVRKLGADFPEELIVAFNAWCDERKLKYGATAGAALQLIQLLPVGLQDLVRREKWDEVRAWFDRAEYWLARELIDRRAEPARPPSPGAHPERPERPTGSTG
jgi:hypothetical protein